MADDFDPRPYRRAERLARLLRAALSGEDPDAGLPEEVRAVRAETRRLLARVLPELPTAEEEDRIIRECHRRAIRTVKRKAKRLASGREWGE